ncbi:MAG TPA: ScyD/ScyE family protein [Puia sp.]|nr:ScyD/ScyE family protein [Puia sp.]
MRKTRLLSMCAILIIALFISSCKKDFPPTCNCDQSQLVASASVFASGLNNPRGLKFGPDGNLYIAEGGIGGTNSSAGLCDQVVPPIGPYTGSTTGARILKISKSGAITTVADNLPSSQTNPGQGSLVSGVGDIAFIGNTLYGVLAGAGCSHGVPTIPNGVVKVLPNKKWDLIADLSSFQKSNPVANPEPDDFEPDGTWYSMQSEGGDLYAVEPNHGEIDKIDRWGHISRVSDISASQGHIVPTSMVFHNGDIYFGNLSTFPITGNSNVYKLSHNGTISIVASGFSMVTGIAFDAVGGLYVLESTTNNPFPTPGTGDVVRIDPSGARATLVSGLSVPTAMTFGPDNKLYISNLGYGAPPGAGEIWKVEITCAKQTKKAS